MVFPWTLLHRCEQRLGPGSTRDCREGAPSLFPSVAWTQSQWQSLMLAGMWGHLCLLCVAGDDSGWRCPC